MKPYYEHDGIVIYHGDCREVLPLVRADVVVTDPPYGMGKAITNDDPALADALIADVFPILRALCGGNILAFWSAQRLAVGLSLMSPKRVLIWDKDWAIFTPNNVGYRYEPLFWISGTNAQRKRGDIFKCFPIIREVQDESVGHPTQKPEGLLREIVADFSSQDETILDPFMGSGTTLRAAKDLGRKAIGIEIEERYCEIAARRLSQEVLPFASLAATGIETARLGLPLAPGTEQNAEEYGTIRSTDPEGDME